MARSIAGRYLIVLGVCLCLVVSAGGALWYFDVWPQYSKAAGPTIILDQVIMLGPGTSCKASHSASLTFCVYTFQLVSVSQSISSGDLVPSLSGNHSIGSQEFAFANFTSSSGCVRSSWATPADTWTVGTGPRFCVGSGPGDLLQSGDSLNLTALPGVTLSGMGLSIELTAAHLPYGGYVSSPIP